VGVLFLNSDTLIFQAGRLSLSVSDEVLIFCKLLLPEMTQLQYTELDQACRWNNVIDGVQCSVKTQKQVLANAANLQTELKQLYAVRGSGSGTTHYTDYWIPEVRVRLFKDQSPETRSSAVAERPRSALCHWIFRYVTPGHSRSSEVTLMSRACVSLY